MYPRKRLRLELKWGPASVGTVTPKFISSKPIFSGGPIRSRQKSHPVFRILGLPGNTAKDTDNNLQS